MFFNQVLNDVDARCINLNIRRDKKKWMNNQLKRRKINDVKFFEAKLHKEPKRGCLESHLTIIKDAIQNRTKHLFIMEDDCKFKTHPNKLPLPPDDWDMIYLGGTVKSIYEKSDDSPWVKMACWTTHAYIINLENQTLVEDLLKMDTFPGEIDTYYIKYIHSKYNAYMINPMMCIQNEGWSDIEQTNVNYDFMEETLKGLRKPRHSIVDGQYSLKLPPIPMEDLPSVSIITPTFERRHMFSVAIWNFTGIYYPADKLEWVIIDDSIDKYNRVEDLLPKDKRIKYYHYEVKERMTIAKKRNLGVEKASHDIIIHMDDDDYYPSETVLARVKVLLKYREEGVECVGCSKIGVYDILNNASSISTDGELSLSEASMAYFRDFWQERNFCELDTVGEYKTFIYDRFDKIMDIPYSFVLIAMSHDDNFTEKKREVTENQLQNPEGQKTNFYDTWDEETKAYIDDLRVFLKNRLEKIKRSRA